MTTVPTVNPETKPVPESEASEQAWVDPMFIEKAQPLGDEPQPEAETKTGDPTPEQIKALLDANPEEKPAGEAGASEEDDDDPEDGGEEGEGGKGEEGQQAEPEKRPRRRSKARRERRQMQRELGELRAQLAALAKPAAEAPLAAEAPEPPKQPTLEQFDYDTEKWAAAMGEWTKSLVESGREEARKAEEAKTKEAAEQAHREALDAFNKRQDDARDKYGDEEFDAAYEKATRVRLPDSIVDLILASEQGAEIAFWLGTHDEDAAKFADMTEAQAAREIGRIEARIAAEQAKAAEKPANGAQAGEDTDTNGAEEAKPAAEAKATPDSPPPQRKPVTKAPDPVPTVSGGAAHGRDPSKMSHEEYRAARMSGQLR